MCLLFMCRWHGVHAGWCIPATSTSARPQRPGGAASVGEGPQPQLLLADDHSLARPCGSTIRKKTIRAPKIIDSGARPARWRSGCRTLPGTLVQRRCGSSTMKAAPKKLPMIEPRPPMITMNSSWNERSIENAAGSHAPRCTKAHRPPATPTMKLDTAKALSLAYIGRMPITEAATSMSRMAIHSRPMSLRTRFLAISAERRRPRPGRTGTSASASRSAGRAPAGRRRSPSPTTSCW